MFDNIKPIPLHCVFHGIRFKVNEDWVSGIDTPSFFIYDIGRFFRLLLPEKEICSVFSFTSYIFSFGVTALCWFFFNAGGIVRSAWV